MANNWFIKAPLLKNDSEDLHRTLNTLYE